jgi:hypothetical protein
MVAQNCLYSWTLRQALKKLENFLLLAVHISSFLFLRFRCRKMARRRSSVRCDVAVVLGGGSLVPGSFDGAESRSYDEQENLDVPSFHEETTYGRMDPKIRRERRWPGSIYTAERTDTSSFPSTPEDGQFLM